MTYVCVDLETTGLSPRHGHRVVEIALVVLDDKLNEVEQFSTLVNPQRTNAATHINGISDDELADAPVFADVAPLLESRLDGSVMVAHNLIFDERFLEAEFEAAMVPLTPTGTVCTKELYGGMSLANACSEVGYRLRGAHRALADAKAAAHLLRCADDFDIEDVFTESEPTHRRAKQSKPVWASHASWKQAKINALLRPDAAAPKRVPLGELLLLMNIKGCGPVTCEMLASNFGSYEAVANADKKQFTALPGIGPATSTSLADYFKDPATTELVARLHQAGVTFDYVPDFKPRADEADEPAAAEPEGAEEDVVGDRAAESAAAQPEVVEPEPPAPAPSTPPPAEPVVIASGDEVPDVARAPARQEPAVPAPATPRGNWRTRPVVFEVVPRSQA